MSVLPHRYGQAQTCPCLLGAPELSLVTSDFHLGGSRPCILCHLAHSPARHLLKMCKIQKAGPLSIHMCVTCDAGIRTPYPTCCYFFHGFACEKILTHHALCCTSGMGCTSPAWIAGASHTSPMVTASACAALSFFLHTHAISRHLDPRPLSIKPHLSSARCRVQRAQTPPEKGASSVTLLT